MRVNAAQDEDAWRPITLTLTFDTKQEAAFLMALMQGDTSVLKDIADSEGGAPFDTHTASLVVNGIYNALAGLL